MILPWPPVILAITSLPQRIPQVRKPPMRSKITRMTIRMMRRTLWDFLGWSSFWVFLVFSGFSDFFGSSSRFKASTGARKSSMASDGSSFFVFGFSVFGSISCSRGF